MDPERHGITPDAVVTATVAGLQRLMLDYMRMIGFARTMTALLRYWFHGTSVSTLTASESLSAGQDTRARSALCRPPTRPAKVGASSSTYPLHPPLHCSDSGAFKLLVFLFLGSYACCVVLFVLF